MSKYGEIPNVTAVRYFYSFYFEESPLNGNSRLKGTSFPYGMSPSKTCEVINFRLVYIRIYIKASRLNKSIQDSKDDYQFHLLGRFFIKKN